MLQQFGYPLPLALGLVILGTVLFWVRWRVTATVFIGIAVAGLYLLATPAVASLLIASLERGFEPRPSDEYPRVDAIVVLGGGILPAASPQLSSNLLDAADRIRTGARLYQARRAPLVITTGARPYPDLGPTAAEAAAGLLQEFGVARQAILARGNSTSTREDALTVRAAVASHDLGQVLLVTSAFHMPRSLATFETVGVDVRPAPSDYKSTDVSVAGVAAWLPDDDAFSLSNKAWHEYAGMAYYRLQGWM